MSSAMTKTHLCVTNLNSICYTSTSFWSFISITITLIIVIIVMLFSMWLSRFEFSRTGKK